MQQFSAGDAGGGKEGIFRSHQIFQAQNFIQLITQFDALLAFGVVAGVNFALHIAAQTAQGAGRQHAFRRAADAKEDVDAGFGHGRH